MDREVDQNSIMYSHVVEFAVVWCLVSRSIFPDKKTQLSSEGTSSSPSLSPEQNVSLDLPTQLSQRWILDSGLDKQLIILFCHILVTKSEGETSRGEICCILQHENQTFHHSVNT